MKTTKQVFIGEFYTEGTCIGNLYKVSEGYIVREVLPFARKAGKCLFNGKIFKAEDLFRLGRTEVGYASVYRYTFKSEVAV